VAVTDIDDGEKYYAQLRGFLEDQYYQKSAVITWLIPSPRSCSAQNSFDPSLYIAGSTVVLLIFIQIMYFYASASPPLLGSARDIMFSCLYVCPWYLWYSLVNFSKHLSVVHLGTKIS